MGAGGQPSSQPMSQTLGAGMQQPMFGGPRLGFGAPQYGGFPGMANYGAFGQPGFNAMQPGQQAKGGMQTGVPPQPTSGGSPQNKPGGQGAPIGSPQIGGGVPALQRMIQMFGGGGQPTGAQPINTSTTPQGSA